MISLLEAVKDDLQLTKEHIDVLNCFLDPNKMLKKEETPNPLNSDAKIYDFTRSGRLSRIVPTGGDKRDAIWEFFNDPKDDEGWRMIRICMHICNCVSFSLKRLYC